MSSLLVWSAIGGLGISSLKLYLDNRTGRKREVMLAGVVKNQREQLEIQRAYLNHMSQGLSQKTLVERERLALEQKKQEGEDLWRKFQAGIKLLDFFIGRDSEDEYASD